MGIFSSRGKRAGFLAGGAFLTAIVLAGCAGAAETAPEPTNDGGGETTVAAEKAPIRVGALLGLTGSYAALGVPEANAVELYFEEVNANGGLNGHEIELVLLDSESDESVLVNQYRKLATEEDVHAVIGPSSSGESIALRAFSLEYMLPTIGLGSASSIVEPPEESTYIFKQYTGTNESLRAQLTFAQEQGWKNLGLIYVNNGYGQDPANQLETVAAEFGITVTGMESFEGSDTDVTAQLGRLAADNPDAVLVWAVNPANAVIAKSAESIGFEPPLFNSPGAGSQDYITNGGSAVEGSYLQGSQVLAFDSMDPADPAYALTQSLIEQYQATYGETPGQYAANGWDGSILIENAILQAGELDPTDVQATRDAIRDSLENNTVSVPAVNSTYTFTPEFHGSLSLEGLAVLVVENGAFRVIQTY